MKVKIKFKDGSKRTFENVSYIKDDFEVIFNEENTPIETINYKEIVFNEIDYESIRINIDKIKSITTYEEY